MRFLGILCAALLCFGAMAKAEQRVTLTSDNTIVIRTPIDGESVAKFLDAFYTSKADPLYVFVNSPGGSVDDGFKIVEALRATKKNVVCIASFAASMAFSIMEACPTRLVTEHAIMMQHVGSYGLKGQAPNNNSMNAFAQRLFESLEKGDAARMGLKLPMFQAKIRDDWWMLGDEAVDNNAADDVAQVLCTAAMTAKHQDVVFNTLFGAITATYSGCPLASDPLAVGMKRNPTVHPAIAEGQYYDFIQQLYVGNFLRDRMNKDAHKK